VHRQDGQCLQPAAGLPRARQPPAPALIVTRAYHLRAFPVRNAIMASRSRAPPRRTPFANHRQNRDHCNVHAASNIFQIWYLIVQCVECLLMKNFL